LLPTISRRAFLYYSLPGSAFHTKLKSLGKTIYQRILLKLGQLPRAMAKLQTSMNFHCFVLEATDRLLSLYKKFNHNT